MYFEPIYDTDTSEIEKMNDTLSIEKCNVLIKNVHKSWCDHLMEVKESTYEVQQLMIYQIIWKFQLRKETILKLHQMVHFIYNLVN